MQNRPSLLPFQAGSGSPVPFGSGLAFKPLSPGSSPVPLPAAPGPIGAPSRQPGHICHVAAVHGPALTSGTACYAAMGLPGCPPCDPVGPIWHSVGTTPYQEMFLPLGNGCSFLRVPQSLGFLEAPLSSRPEGIALGTPWWRVPFLLDLLLALGASWRTQGGPHSLLFTPKFILP